MRCWFWYNPHFSFNGCLIIIINRLHLVIKLIQNVKFWRVRWKFTFISMFATGYNLHWTTFLHRLGLQHARIECGLDVGLLCLLRVTLLLSFTLKLNTIIPSLWWSRGDFICCKSYNVYVVVYNVLLKSGSLNYSKHLGAHNFQFKSITEISHFYKIFSINISRNTTYVNVTYVSLFLRT